MTEVCKSIVIGQIKSAFNLERYSISDDSYFFNLFAIMARRYTAKTISQLILDGLTDSESDNSDMGDLVNENENSSDDSEDDEDDSLSADSGDENAPAARVRAPVSDIDWTDVKLRDCGPTMLQFFSQGSSGRANLENCCRAIDYFNLFFTSEILQDIFDQVNRYAEEKISNGNLKPASRLRQWRAANTEEFMRFLGILMNMGIVRLLSVQMYWTTKWTENVPFFRDSISCNHFLLLYHTTLHVCHTNPNTNPGRGHKITPRF